MEQAQGPAKGTPVSQGSPDKKVDVMEAVLARMQMPDGTIDPGKMAYALGKRFRAGEFNLEFGDKDEYVNGIIRSDIWKDSGLSGEQIEERAKAMVNMASDIFIKAGDDNEFRKNVIRRPSYLQRIGLQSTDSESIRTNMNPWRSYMASGDTYDNGLLEQMADVSGYFEDRFGRTLSEPTGKVGTALGGSSRYGVEADKLYAKWTTGTNHEGDPIDVPAWAEMPEGDFDASKKVKSVWGAQPETRNWLGAALVGAGREVSLLGGIVAGVAGESYQSITNSRLEKLYAAYRHFGGPDNAADYVRAVNTGELAPNASELNTLQDEEDASESQIGQLVDHLSEDEEKWRFLAKQGDEKARAAIDLIDWWKNVYEDGGGFSGTLSRIVTTATRSQDSWMPAVSQRALEQGAFGGVEGFSNFLGQVAGQIGPQAAATRMLAGGLVKYGGKRLVTRQAAANFAPTLTHGGRMAVRGVSGLIPGMQVWASTVDGAREIGVSDSAANWLGFGLGTFTMGLSGAISPTWMARKYWETGGHEGAKAAIMESLEKELPRGFTQRISDRVMKNALAKTTKNFFDRYKIPAKTKGGKIFQRGMESGLKESGEEISEEVAAIIGEQITDQLTDEKHFSNNAASMDWFNRLLQAGAAGFIGGFGTGAIIGGDHPQSAGRDKATPISRAVAAGNGSRVKLLADRMLKDGQITKGEHTAIMADVLIAQQAMNSMRVIDPHSLSQMLNEKDLTVEYVQARKNITSRAKKIAELGSSLQFGALDETGRTAASTEVAELQRLTTEDQARMQSILDGHEVADRLIHRAMETLGGNDEQLMVKGVRNMTDALRQVLAARREIVKEGAPNRADAKKLIDAALEKLNVSGARDLGLAGEALLKVNEAFNEAGSKKAVAKEDYARLREVVTQAREKAREEINKNFEVVDSEGVTGGLIDVAERDGWDEKDLLVQYIKDEQAKEDAAEVESRLREKEREQANGGQTELPFEKAEKQGESKSMSALLHLTALNRLDNQLLALGSVGDDFEANTSDMVSEDEFKNGADEVKALSLFLKNPHLPGESVSLGSAIARFKQIVNPSAQDVAELRDVIDRVRGMLATVRGMKGPLMEMMAGLDNAGVYDKGASPVPGLEALGKDRAEVWNKVASLPGDVANDLSEYLAELEKMAMEFDKNLDHRKSELGRIEKNANILESQFIIELSSILNTDEDKDFSARLKETAAALGEVITREENGTEVLTTVKDAQGGSTVHKRYLPAFKISDLAEVRRLCNVMRPHISSFLRTKSAAEIGRIMSVFHSNMGLDAGANYMDDSWLRLLGASDYTNAAEVLNRGTDIVRSSLTMRVFGNWLSTLYRTDVATLTKAWSDALEAKGKNRPATNNEQSREGMFIASFLLNPSEELTEKITEVGGRSLERHESGKQMAVPRAVAMPGSQGVGKTHTVRFVMEAVRNYRKAQGQVAPKILVVAPSKGNRDRLQDDLSKQDKHEMAGDAIGLDDLDKIAASEADIIIVDEAHALSRNHVNKLAEAMNNPKMAGASLLFVGDQYQMPPLRDAKESMAAFRGVMTAMPLQVSFRHGDIDLMHTLENLHWQMVMRSRQGRDLVQQLSVTRYAKGMKGGVKLINSNNEQSVYDALLEHLASADGAYKSGVTLIVANAEQRKVAVSYLKSKGVDVDANVAGQSVRVATLDSDEHSILGDSADLVFVSISPDRLGSAYDQALYTAVGRARSAAVALYSGGTSTEQDEPRMAQVSDSAKREMWDSERARMAEQTKYQSPSRKVHPDAAGPNVQKANATTTTPPPAGPTGSGSAASSTNPPPPPAGPSGASTSTGNPPADEKKEWPKDAAFQLGDRIVHDNAFGVVTGLVNPSATLRLYTVKMDDGSEFTVGEAQLTPAAKKQEEAPPPPAGGQSSQPPSGGPFTGSDIPMPVIGSAEPAPNGTKWTVGYGLRSEDGGPRNYNRKQSGGLVTSSDVFMEVGASDPFFSDSAKRSALLRFRFEVQKALASLPPEKRKVRLVYRTKGKRMTYVNSENGARVFMTQDAVIEVQMTEETYEAIKGLVDTSLGVANRYREEIISGGRHLTMGFLGEFGANGFVDDGLRTVMNVASGAADAQVIADGVNLSQDGMLPLRIESLPSVLPARLDDDSRSGLDIIAEALDGIDPTLNEGRSLVLKPFEKGEKGKKRSGVKDNLQWGYAFRNPDGTVTELKFDPPILRDDDFRQGGLLYEDIHNGSGILVARLIEREVQVDPDVEVGKRPQVFRAIQEARIPSSGVKEGRKTISERFAETPFSRASEKNANAIGHILDIVRDMKASNDGGASIDKLLEALLKAKQDFDKITNAEVQPGVFVKAFNNWAVAVWEDRSGGTFTLPPESERMLTGGIRYARAGGFLVHATVDVNGEKRTLEEVISSTLSRGGEVPSLDAESIGSPSTPTGAQSTEVEESAGSSLGSRGPRSIRGASSSARENAKPSFYDQEGRRQAVEQVIEYYRRVFGNKFVENQLEFRARLLSMDGRELWGIMENARIILEAKGGTVLHGVARHEAAHYVIDHLLDAESRKKILDEAREHLMRDKKLESHQVTETMMHEYVAERAEAKKFETSSMLGRFLRWMKGVMRRWGLVRQSIDDLLWRIEDGEFRDNEPSGAYAPPRFSQKQDDDNRDENGEKPKGENLYGGRSESGRTSDMEADADARARLRSRIQARMLLNTTFGSIAAGRIQDSFSSAIKNSGEWQSTLEEDLTWPLSTTKECVRQYLEETKGLVANLTDEDVHVSMTDGTRVHFRDLTADQAIGLDQERRENWEAFKMVQSSEDGRFRVYEAMVNALFPGVDAQKFISDPKGTIAAPNEATDIDQEMYQSGFANIDKETISPYDQSSGTVKFILETMRQMESVEDGSKSGRVVERPRAVNMDLAIRILAVASQRALQNRGDRSFEEQMGFELQAFYSDITGDRTRVSGTNFEDDAQSNHARALYMHFFSRMPFYVDRYVDGRGWVPTKTFGYGLMSDPTNEKSWKTTYANDPVALANISRRVATARAIRNDFLSWAMSISPTSYNHLFVTESQFRKAADDTYYRTMPVVKPHVQYFEHAKQSAMVFAKEMNGLFIASGNKLSIDPARRSLWTVGLDSDPKTEGTSYVINARGVFSKTGTEIVRFGTASPKGVPTPTNQLITNNIVLVRDFLQAVGMRLPGKTVSALVREAVQAQERSIGDTAVSTLLGNALGDFARLIAASIHTVETGERPSWTHPSRSIRKDLRVSHIASGSYSDLGEGLKIPAPSMAIDYIEMIAKRDAEVMGTDSSRRYIGPKGTVVQADPFGNLLKRIFPGSEGNENDSAVRVWAERAAHLPLFLGNKSLNPFVRNKKGSPHLIKPRLLFFSGAVKEDYSDGEKLADMTSWDKNAGLFSQFAQYFVTGVVRVPLRPYSNRSLRPVMEMAASRFTTLSPRKADTNGRDSYELDWSKISEFVKDRFIFHEAIRIQSLERWATLLGAPSVDGKVDESALSTLLAGINADPVARTEFAKLLVTSGAMTAELDYKTSGDGTVNFGNAIVRGAGMFNHANYELLKEAIANNSQTQFVKSLYAQQILEFRQQLMSMSPDDSLKWPWVAGLTNGLSEAQNEAIGEAYVVIQHLVNEWTDDFAAGPAEYYKNEEDWIKRGAIPLAPGRIGLFQQGETPRVAIMQDPQPGPDGRPVPRKPFDGQAVTTPWGWLLAREAYGGNYGVWNNVVNKRVYAGSGFMMKYSEETPSPTWYRMNPLWAQQIDRSLLLPPGVRSPETAPIFDHIHWSSGMLGSTVAAAPDVPQDLLQKVWTEADKSTPQGYWAAAQAVIDKAREFGIADHLIHLLSSVDNVKVGLKGSNFFEDSDVMVSNPLDPEGWLLQTDLERDMEDQRVARPSQLSLMMGIGHWNTERGKRIQEIERAVTENWIQRIKGQFSDESIPAHERKERLISFLRDITLDSEAKRGEIGGVVEALTNPNTSMNDPWIQEKVVRAFMADLRNKGLVRKLRGQAFVQASGHGLLIPSGETTLDANGVEGMVMRGLLPPRVEMVNGVGTYMPGEVVMRWMHARDFGFNDGEWEHLTQAEVRAIIKEKVRRRELPINALEEFEDSLMVVVSRTPGSTPSSAQRMRIVEFINDMGNTIHVPPGLNDFTGGDQDGDTLGVFLKTPFVPRSDTRSDAALNNRFIEEVEGYFADLNNLSLVMLKTGTDRIKAVRNDRLANTIGSSKGDFHTALRSMVADKNVFDGEGAIGYVGYFLKAYSYLSQAAQRMGPEEAQVAFGGFVPQIRDRDGFFVIDNISQVLNAALDNGKDPILGDLNVTPDNLSIVLAQLMVGVPLHEAFSILDSNDMLSIQYRSDINRSQINNAVGKRYRGLLEAAAKSSQDTKAAVVTAANYMKMFDGILALSSQFGLNTSNGVPSSIDDLTDFIRKTSVDDPGKEDLGVFDMKKILEHLPSVAASVEAVDLSRDLLSSVILPLQDDYMDLVSNVSDTLFGGYVTDSAKKRLKGGLTDALVGDAISRIYFGKKFNLGDDKLTVDLSTRNGQYLFAAQFPHYFMEMEGRLRAQAAENAALDEKIRKNTFLNRIRTEGGSSIFLTMLSANVVSDPMVKERMRQDAKKLDDLFEGQNGIPFTEMLGIYSMITERFRFKNGSIFPFLPISATIAYGRELDKDVLVLNSRLERDEATAIASGFFARSFAASNPRLIQGNKKGRYTGVRGEEGNVTLYDKATQETLMPIFSNVVSPLSLRQDLVVTANESLPGISTSAVLSLSRGGNASLTLPFNMGHEPGPISLPSGYRAEITGVDPETRVITLSSGGSHALNETLNEDVQDFKGPSELYAGMETASYMPGTGHHGVGHTHVDGKDAGVVLERIAKMGHPAYQAIAQLMLDEHRRSGRKAMITVVDEIEGYPGDVGRIDADGNIQVVRRLNGLGVDLTILHEVAHRFTAAVFSAKQEDRTPAEQQYVEAVEKLFDEVKKKWEEAGLGNEYYLSDVYEFVAGAWTSARFQQKLRSLAPSSEPSGPRTFWGRLVAAFKALFKAKAGGEVIEHAMLEKLLDLTHSYVRYASESGRTDYRPATGPMSYEEAIASGRFHLGPQSHGLKADLPPVKDIRDIATRLRTAPSLPQDADQMDMDSLVASIRKRAKQNFYKYKVGGYEFKFVHSDGTPLSDKEIAEVIKQDVLPVVKNSSSQRKSDIADILNDTSGKKPIERVFSTKDRPVQDIKSDLRSLKEAVGHTSETVYVRWSSLKDPDAYIETGRGQVTISELGVKWTDGFEGYDPIVAIRPTDSGPVVSLLELTPARLTKQPLGRKGLPLFANYGLGVATSPAYRMSLVNDEGDVRKLMVAMTAMAIRQANPDVRFDSMVVANIGPVKLSYEAVQMFDVLRDLSSAAKVPAFAAELTPGMKSLISDPQVMDGRNYDQGILKEVGRIMADHGRSLSTSVRSALDLYEKGDMGSKKTLRDAIVFRMRQLEMSVGGEVEQDDEYRIMTNLLYALGHDDVRGVNTVEDLTRIRALLVNPMDVPNDAFQFARAAMNRSSALIAHKVRKDHLEHIALFEKIDTMRGLHAAMEWSVGGGHRRFSHLWRWSSTNGRGLVVNGVDGVPVRVKLNMLHWNEEDPDTADALRDGSITQEELAYTNKILDKVEEYLIDQFKHDLRRSGAFLLPVANEVDEEALEAAAKKEYHQRWTRGWMPIVKTGMNESLMNARLSELGSRIKDSVNATGSIYEETFLEEHSVDKYFIANRYLSEAESAASYIGGSIRLDRLGMKEQGDGSILLVDPSANTGITENLEAIMLHMSLACHRKIIHEERTLPELNAAFMELERIRVQQGKDLANVRKLLEDYARRRVYNVPPLDNSLNIQGRNFNTAANFAMKMTSMGGVAWDVKVGLASTVFNNTAFFSTAGANDGAKNGLYGMNSARKAWAQCGAWGSQGNLKARALARMLFVNEMQEGDEVNDERFRKTGGQLFTSHSLQIANWLSDYHIRCAVMAAQMMEDGTWDAFTYKDGEVTYDEKKDRRFYNEDGTKKPGADALIRKLKERIAEDGVHEQDFDKPLVVAYDIKSGQAMKTLADKYVVGGMDPSERVMLTGIIFGRSILQFRNYLPSRITNWIATGFDSDALGTWAVEGEGKEAVWMKREIQSSMGALVKAIALVGEARKTSFKEAFGSDRWTQADRFAFQKVCQDLVLGMLFVVAFAAMGAAAAEDKKNRRRGKKGNVLLYDKRVLDMFKNGAFDVLAGSPISMLRVAGEGSLIPAASNTWRALGYVFKDPVKLLNFAPANKTVGMTWEYAFDEGEKQNKQPD